MNQSDKINMNETEFTTFSETIRVISPAIAEVIRAKDSGEITIYFHEGKFKRAKKTVTV